MSSIFVSRACKTSSASIPCTAMVVSPFLSTELCPESLAQLLHDSCLNAVHFIISQGAIISAIDEGKGEAFFANRDGLAGVDVEQANRAQSFRMEVLDRFHNLTRLHRRIDD